MTCFSFFQLSFVIFLFVAFNQVQRNCASNGYVVGYFNESSYASVFHSFTFYTTPIGFSFKTCQENGKLFEQVRLSKVKI